MHTIILVVTKQIVNFHVNLHDYSLKSALLCIHVYICTCLSSAAGGIVCELVQNDCIVDYEVVLSGPFDTIVFSFRLCVCV